MEFRQFSPRPKFVFEMIASNGVENGLEKATRKKKVLVTGFAAFHNFKINASFEVARFLDRYEGTDYQLEAWPFSIKTEYKYVSHIVRRLWREQFDLLVHIGIASGTVVRAEQRARREPYANADNAGRLLTAPFSSDLPRELQTDLPLDDIPFISNAQVSIDAGLFLCEYIYFHSLLIAQNKGRKVFFIHVPPNASPDEVVQTCGTVIQMLDALMKHVPFEKA